MGEKKWLASYLTKKEKSDQIYKKIGKKNDKKLIISAYIIQLALKNFSFFRKSVYEEQSFYLWLFKRDKDQEIMRFYYSLLKLSQGLTSVKNLFGFMIGRGFDAFGVRALLWSISVKWASTLLKLQGLFLKCLILLNILFLESIIVNFSFSH